MEGPERVDGVLQYLDTILAESKLQEERTGCGRETT